MSTMGHIGESPLKRSQMTFHKEDKCPVCSVKFLKDDNTLLKNIIKVPNYGLVHDSCFTPFIKEEELRILYKIRCYSIGDTITVTPALRELRTIYPRAYITVMTFFPELFQYNPCVNALYDLSRPITEDEMNSHHFHVDAFNSDKGHHFAMHSVDFSAASALDRAIFPHHWNYDLFYGTDERTSAKKIITDAGIDIENDKLILVHPHGTEWKTRDWGPHHMPELVRRIKEKLPEHKIVSIGGKRDVKAHEMKNYVELPEAINLYGKLTLLQTAAFMDMPCCKLLVTPDTGTLHLGASRQELPIVGIFTLIRAHFRTPVRKGKYSYKFIGIEAESGCNCTYQNRQLSNEMRFDTCPKLDFLKHTRTINIPKNFKLEGVRNFFPDTEWNADDLNKQIIDKEREFKYESLPCFPSVDKAMLAVEKAMELWGAE